MIATAPGKLILTGEYAVLDGAPAVVAAIDRRVVARRGAPAADSAFLRAVANELASRLGAEHPAARAAREITVDSAAFYDGATKLGLGSSAAVTVAATALALGETPVDRDRVLAIAQAAHAAAQAPRGTRGSGADIAAAVCGGVIVYTAGSRVRAARWPEVTRLLPFFTGASADTPVLVARIAEARAARPAEVEAALAAIADASHGVIDALDTPGARDAREPRDASGTREAAGALIAAFDRAAAATERLADATGVELVPRCVAAARSAMARLGGTAKTTGAGGGDIAVAVLPATADVTIATRMLVEAGCQPLQLSVDPAGVDTRPGAQ